MRCSLSTLKLAGCHRPLGLTFPHVACRAQPRRAVVVADLCATRLALVLNTPREVAGSIRSASEVCSAVVPKILRTYLWNKGSEPFACAGIWHVCISACAGPQSGCPTCGRAWATHPVARSIRTSPRRVTMPRKVADQRTRCAQSQDYSNPTRRVLQPYTAG